MLQKRALDVKAGELWAMAKFYATNEMKLAREKRGMTQAEAAQMLGIEMGRDIAMVTYQKWEQGALNITPENALMICRFFRLQPKEMLTSKWKNNDIIAASAAQKNFPGIFILCIFHTLK